MHVDLAFPNDYLKAADLVGKDFTWTISKVVSEVLSRSDGTEEPAWILYFTELEARHAAGKSDRNKRLVMNKTNGMLIKKNHGGEMEDWIGKKITLYPTTCMAFGETVECIRVRPPKGDR